MTIKKFQMKDLLEQVASSQEAKAVSEETEEEVVEETEVSEETLEETTAADSLKPASRSGGEDPKSRVEIMKTMIGAMAEMPKRDLVKWFDQTQALYHKGKDWGVGDKSGSNQASVDMKGGKGPKTRDAMPTLNVKEDVEEMFNGQDLSEEFKTNAATLFEAAVSARVVVEQARLEEEFESKLTEAVTEITEELTTKVDAYLDYIVESWMEANEVAIESTLRNELMEEFIEGLKGLFAEHYIEVPADKIDVLESLAAKVEALEAKLDETINENAELKNAVADVEKVQVFEELCDGLALSQVEKFKALAEGIEFDGDIETYSKKLAFVKESYFKEKTAPAASNIEEETFEGETTTTTSVIDPIVNRYVQAISQTVKK
jgi:hypothetical protein